MAKVKQCGATGYMSDPSGGPPGGSLGPSPDPDAPADTIALFWAGVYMPEVGDECCGKPTVDFWLTINPNNNWTTSNFLVNTNNFQIFVSPLATLCRFPYN